MNPPCHRCKKTVYPVEKLNCLDKIWHKGCFNCETCHLTLSLKTYKGYAKLPYCPTHYPTTKFTAVADTPENKRLAQQAKQQSEVVYHKSAVSDFSVVVDESDRASLASKQSNSGLKYQEKRGDRLVAEARPPPRRNHDPKPAPDVASGPPPATPGLSYVALYDYNAADDDEISFNEGDKLINCESIDEGWMTGCVERTGEHGMFPSNYVEED